MSFLSGVGNYFAELLRCMIESDTFVLKIIIENIIQCCNHHIQERNELMVITVRFQIGEMFLKESTQSL